MAPKVGLEPTTNRLTAGCSTTELLRNIIITSWRTLALYIYYYNNRQKIYKHFLKIFKSFLIFHHPSFINIYDILIIKAPAYRLYTSGSTEVIKEVVIV